MKKEKQPRLAKAMCPYQTDCKAGEQTMGFYPIHTQTECKLTAGLKGK